MEKSHTNHYDTDNIIYIYMTKVKKKKTNIYEV